MWYSQLLALPDLALGHNSHLESEPVEGLGDPYLPITQEKENYKW